MTGLKRLINRLVPRSRANAYERIHEENFGVNLGEWPERAQEAMALLQPLRAEIGEAATAADWGCGKQIVRKLIPPGWTYVPYDRLSRSADTRIHDFNRGAPDGSADVIFCLGMLEYIDDFWGVLGAAIERSRFCVFSHVGATTDEHRRRNGWKWALPLAEIDAFLEERGATRCGFVQKPTTGAIYLVRGKRP